MSYTRLALSLVFVSALAPCPAQAPLGAQVDGVVLDTVSGAPVRRAVVQLRYSGNNPAIMHSLENADYVAMTGPDGAFHFKQLPPGSYSLSYSRSGYLLPRTSSGYSALSFRTSEGGAVTGLRYALIPQAVIAGRVLDDEGEPVEGIQVSVLAFRYSGGVRKLTRLNESSPTNDRGEYRIARLPAGKYFLQASLDRLLPGAVLLAAPRAPGAPLVSFASTFYPGVTDSGQALRLELRSGQELSGIDIPLQRSAMVHVSGRLIGVDGAPLPRTSLTLISSQSRLPAGFGAPTDEGGNFVLNNVRSGSYILHAVSSDSRIIWTPLEVGSTDIIGFAAQASPAVSVHGSIVVEDAPRNFNLSSVGVSLRSADRGAFSGDVRASADGSFVLEGPLPGRYVANVDCGTSGVYAQSISVGGEEVLGRDFDLAAAASGLRIMLRGDSATLKGTAGPVEEATKPTDRQGRPAMILIPADSRMRGVDMIAPVAISAKNSFQAYGLRPGEYFAIAFDDVDDQQLQDPEFLTSLEPLGVRVQLSPGATQTVTLKWNPWPQTAAGY